MKNLKFKKFWAIGAALLVLAPLASCSNEEAVTVPEVEVRPLAPGEETTVTIYIPQLINQSRATQIVDADEANINELWICAYAHDDGTNVVQQIVNEEKAIGFQRYKNESHGYVQTATVKLKEGKYTIYLIANINGYLANEDKIEATTSNPDGSTSGGTSEATIKALPLTFADIATVQKLKKKNLPMVCSHSAIKTSANGAAFGSETSYFNLTETGQEIYADMTLMCAKVRYTILFDKTSFSNQFESNLVSFTTSNIKNINKKTVWNVTTTPDDDNYFTTATDFTTTSDFKSVKYPNSDDQTQSYLNISALAGSDDSAPANLAGYTHKPEDKQRAWQGIVYLPENTNSSKQTIFSFKTAANSNVQDEKCTFGLSLERGSFYDVVAQLKTPDKLYLNVLVYLKVNPWTYMPSEIPNW